MLINNRDPLKGWVLSCRKLEKVGPNVNGKAMSAWICTKNSKNQISLKASHPKNSINDHSLCKLWRVGLHKLYIYPYLKTVSLKQIYSVKKCQDMMRNTCNGNVEYPGSWLASAQMIIRHFYLHWKAPSWPCWAMSDLCHYCGVIWPSIGQDCCPVWIKTSMFAFPVLNCNNVYMFICVISSSV